MALVDMKHTKAEKKAQNSPNKMTGVDSADYPYGLGIHLDHEGLKKLGITDLPTVGTKLHLLAHAHVTEVSQETRDGGTPRRRVHLQLQKMSLGSKPQQGHIEDGVANGAKEAMDAALSRSESKSEKTKGGFGLAKAKE